jgi:CRISPR-associated protein Cst1
MRLTGFVLPDVGFLTMTAWVGKRDPSKLTKADLDEIADFLEGFYSAGIGRGLAAGVVFPNSGFVQSAFDKPEFQHKRTAWANFVLRGHQQLDLEPILQALDKDEYRAMVLRGVKDAPRCAFTGEEAYLRVTRDMLPMLNGRGIMNFSSMGEAGLPVSAEILLAIHALPLGCVMTQGALLAVESDEPVLMFEFVKVNVENNRRFISLAQENSYEKYPNTSAYKSRLIDVLVNAMSLQNFAKEDFRAPALNAYHFSNNGTSARVTVYSLPSSTVAFVRDANKGEHQAVWQRIVASARYEDKQEGEELQQKAPKLTQRNLLYDDLFDLPENAHQFLRTYFLRYGLRKLKNDPRGNYNLFADSNLLSWGLTRLFLKRMMNMDAKRIEALRVLGDNLATYIYDLDQRKLLKTLYGTRYYGEFRKELLKAMTHFSERTRPDTEPLVSYDGFVDGFIKIFEEGDEFEKPDWNLSRDLLLIRIFEQLHHKGYLSKVADELQTEEETN